MRIHLPFTAPRVLLRSGRPRSLKRQLLFVYTTIRQPCFFAMTSSAGNQWTECDPPTNARVRAELGSP